MSLRSPSIWNTCWAAFSMFCICRAENKNTFRGLFFLRHHSVKRMGGYRKLKLKGVHIRWSKKNVFPEYDNTSGPLVSQRRINRLKILLILLIKEEKDRILRAFKNFAKKRYDKPITVSMDLNTTIERIHRTFVCKSESAYGESDESKIWITGNEKMSSTYLFGTMLHECLHYMCTFNDKWISESDEHAIMRSLGEDC